MTEKVYMVKLNEVFFDDKFLELYLDTNFKENKYCIMEDKHGDKLLFTKQELSEVMDGALYHVIEEEWKNPLIELIEYNEVEK